MLHRPTQREQFLAQLDDFAARVREAFLAAIFSIRSRFKSRLLLTRVVTLLERHDTEGAIRALGIEGPTFNPMLDELQAAYNAGGGGVANELPALRDPEGFPITITFDPRNPVAEAWIRQNGATLVRGIVDDQVTMLRKVLAEAIPAGISPRSVALDIVGRINRATGQREGGLIGLTSRQEQSVRNFEAELRALDRNALTRPLPSALKKALRAAVEAGKPLSTDSIAKLSTVYRNGLLKTRGTTIGRTETLKALNAARDESMRQTIASGAVSGNLVDQRWMTIMDGRERLSHAAMNGQVQPFGQSFISGLGNRLQYPGDPSAPAEDVVNCRCSKVFIVRKAS